MKSVKHLQSVAVIALFSVFAVSEAFGEPATKVPAVDCSKAAGLLENSICENEILAMKHKILTDMYHLYARSKEKYPLAIRLEHTQWLKRLNSCEARECIDFWYTSRINALADDLYSNVAAYEICPATGRCLLMDRIHVSDYLGNRVIVDEVEFIECFRGCSPPRSVYYVYETEEGKRRVTTQWGGSFAYSRTKLDRRHADYSDLSGQQKEITRIYFGADESGCQDCYKITNIIERTADGWSAKVVD